MITAISPTPPTLKVVVNNHGTAPHRPVRKIPYSAGHKPVTLIPGEFIAVTAFNMLGINANAVMNSNTRMFLEKCRQQKLLGTQPGKTMLALVQPSIDKLTDIFNIHPEISTGRTTWNCTAEHPFELLSGDENHVIALSRRYQNKEFLIAYNASVNEPTEVCIKLGGNQYSSRHLQVLYGYESCGNVHIYNTVLKGELVSYIKLYLKPAHLVILKNF